jgi:hypothetical protein
MCSEQPRTPKSRDSVATDPLPGLSGDSGRARRRVGPLSFGHPLTTKRERADKFCPIVETSEQQVNTSLQSAVVW